MNVNFERIREGQQRLFRREGKGKNRQSADRQMVGQFRYRRRDFKIEKQETLDRIKNPTFEPRQLHWPGLFSLRQLAFFS